MTYAMHQRAASRRGMTLVELLVVVSIAVILATLSLGTVKGLLKDQKISQASRLVEQYLESARVRALTNGRPVAVFLERVDLTSPHFDLQNNRFDPGSSNFVCTRLSIGEVFPPYTGDMVDATGTLWDVNFAAAAPNIASRPADGFADQVRFNTADVASGFGTSSSDPGFIRVGDTIEFVGSEGRFRIENIDFAGLETRVTFFNPPENYNFARASSPDPLWEGSMAISPPLMPVATTAIVGVAGPTPSGTQVLKRFRVYRQPSKSMVGAITLPRGCCIDLAVSGAGRWSSGVDVAVPSPTSAIAGGVDATLGNAFNLATLPLGTMSQMPGDFSRIAILFNGQGVAKSLICESNLTGTKVSSGFPLDNVLHLMVGRPEQVLPLEAGSLQSRKLAALMTPNGRDEVLSNLLDPGNRWVTINPFSGLIQSSPVGAVSSVTLQNAMTAVSQDATKSIASVVGEARALSTAGANNAGL